MIKFHKGLELAMQNRVVLLGSSVPDFDDPKGWYEAARRVARNREANNVFMEANRGNSRVTPQPPMPPKLVWVTPLTPATFWQVPAPIPMAQKDGPAPMDVDRAQAQVALPGICL